MIETGNVTHSKYVLCEECADKNVLLPRHFCGHEDDDLRLYYWDSQFESYVLDKSNDMELWYNKKVSEWKICAKCIDITLSKDCFCKKCLQKSHTNLQTMFSYSELDNLICFMQYLAYEKASKSYVEKMREYVFVKNKLQIKICSEETHV